MTEQVPVGAARDLQREGRQWAMFLHFSTLLGFPIPVVGFMAPILIWQLKKDDFPEIDRHGKIVTNWIITAAILGAIAAVLTFILIGIVLMWALGVLMVLFAVIGGIKANNGEVWEYPVGIPVLK